MKSKNIYSIPLKKGVNYIALSDPKAHFGRSKHAIDFVIDFNVPIISPLDGEVWNVKDDASKGGNNLKYTAWKYQNIITLKHSNNEYSQFNHLAQGSSKVKIGDKVRKGDIIASGIDMIGCTTNPHVHFMVFKVLDEDKNEWESLKIRFDRKIKILKEDDEYERILNLPKNKILKELKEKYYK